MLLQVVAGQTKKYHFLKKKISATYRSGEWTTASFQWIHVDVNIADTVPRKEEGKTVL